MLKGLKNTRTNKVPSELKFYFLSVQSEITFSLSASLRVTNYETNGVRHTHSFISKHASNTLSLLIPSVHVLYHIDLFKPCSSSFSVRL